MQTPDSPSRRTWLGAATALALSGITPFARAQAFPSRPVEIVVPYPPGASVDFIGRTLQARLPSLLGQSVIIDNKGGAGGNIGAAYVGKSTPDGYRLLLATNAIMTINPHVSKNANFDPLKELAPVAQIANGPIGIAVRADMPVNSLAELVALARKNPGKLSYGSAGNGSPQHVIGEMLKQQASIFMVHVPYRGIGPALTDLLGGNINVVVSTLAGLTPLVTAGKLKQGAGHCRSQALRGHAVHPHRGRDLPRLRSLLVVWHLRAGRHARQRHHPPEHRVQCRRGLRRRQDQAAEQRPRPCNGHAGGAGQADAGRPRALGQVDQG